MKCCKISEHKQISGICSKSFWQSQITFLSTVIAPQHSVLKQPSKLFTPLVILTLRNDRYLTEYIHITSYMYQNITEHTHTQCKNIKHRSVTTMTSSCIEHRCAQHKHKHNSGRKPFATSQQNNIQECQWTKNLTNLMHSVVN